MTETDGRLNPGVGSEFIGGRPLATQAHHPQIGDRVRVTVGRGRVIPGFGASIVHGHAAACMVCQSDQELSADTTGLGGVQKVYECAARIGARQPAVEVSRGGRSWN